MKHITSLSYLFQYYGHTFHLVDHTEASVGWLRPVNDVSIQTSEMEELGYVLPNVENTGSLSLVVSYNIGTDYQRVLLC